MFELLRLVVDLVPLEAEDLGQHPLDEVVPVQKPGRDLPPFGRQLNLALVSHEDQAIALQPLDGHRDGRRRDVQPPRQSHGLDGLSLGLRFRDGLEVIFLGNRDSHADL